MKKLVFLSIISFLLFSMSSCYSLKTISSQEKFYECMKVKNGKYATNEKIKVLSVISKKGDTIDFSKDSPGIVSEQGVSGSQKFYFPYSAVDSTVFEIGALQSFWVDGINYEFIKQDRQGYVCINSNPITIPLTEIDRMKIIKQNVPATVAVIAVPAALATAGIVWYISYQMLNSIFGL